MQTELLRGFEAFSHVQTIRLRKVEVDRPISTPLYRDAPVFSKIAGNKLRCVWDLRASDEAEALPSLN